MSGNEDRDATKGDRAGGSPAHHSENIEEWIDGLNDLWGDDCPSECAYREARNRVGAAGGECVSNSNEGAGTISFAPTLVYRMPDGRRVRVTYSGVSIDSAPRRED